MKMNLTLGQKKRNHTPANILKLYIIVDKLDKIMLTYSGVFQGFLIIAPGLTVSLFLWGLLLSLEIIYRCENHSNILNIISGQMYSGSLF